MMVVLDRVERRIEENSADEDRKKEYRMQHKRTVHAMAIFIESTAFCGGCLIVMGVDEKLQYCMDMQGHINLITSDL
jgi:hypothetical protein